MPGCLIQVARYNTGVPFDAYTVTKIFDPGLNLLGSEDDQMLPIYSRPPSTFGLDKYVLQNILGAPPPAPPADVPVLDEGAVGNTGTLRQQLEKHRSNPTCAACHNRMDVLGFGLENYDAVGRWRSAEAGLPIDVTGVLPDGSQLAGPGGLRKLLVERRPREIKLHLDRPYRAPYVKQ